MKTFSAAIVAVGIVVVNAPAASAHMHGYRHKIVASFTTPRKIGTFFCRVTIAGATRTTIGPCGPVRAQ